MTRARSAQQHAQRLAPLLLLAAACSEPPPPDDGTPAREGRLGSLRDLVLFERAHLPATQALFVDRFEVTRGDWEKFAATPAGRVVGAGSAPTGGDPALPIGSVDLRQARAFAHWRSLRLPRTDEWWFVAVGDRDNLFPWGNRADPARANTGELGLGQPTPVGTFESGRRAGGDQPYDLVGNVSEWTESVASRWWDGLGVLADGEALDPVGPHAARRTVLANPLLALWQGPGGLVPAGWLTAAGGPHVPRDVVGADFQSPMSGSALVEAVFTGDQRGRTGLRLYTTAGELLVALTNDPAELDAADALRVRRFVRRGRHRAVLVEAWAQLVAARQGRLGAGPLAAILREELGVADRTGR